MMRLNIAATLALCAATTVAAFSNGDVTARGASATNDDNVIPCADTAEASESQRYLERSAGMPPARAADLLETAIAEYPDDRRVRTALVNAYLKLGRSELRGGSIPRGRMAYAKALAFKPTSRPAQQGRQTARALEKRLSAQADALRHELSKRPANDYARLQLGIALERLGDPDAAFAQYKKMIKGKIDFDGGVERIHELRRLLERSIVLLPPADDPRRPEPKQPGPRQEAHSEHFTVLHHNAELAARAVKAAEDAYVGALRALGRPLPEASRATVYLVPKRREFERLTGNSGISGHATVNGTIHVYASAPDVIRSTLRHEVAHLAAFRTVGKLPMWADEGLAIRQETDCLLHYIRMRHVVAQKQFIPLSRFFSVRSAKELKTPAAIDLFYQEAFTFVDFLLERHGGVEKLIRFARAASSGSADAAASRIYDVDGTEELQRQWVDFVTQ